MSIIVQAGHKTSKSKQVMEKLYERGLSRPNDSYTHNMTAEQVSETLYEVLARENMSSANEKMADNVMTDFLLANLDFENWGWESDKNLAGLEYWQQNEPDVGFVLVFDHPSNILKEFADVALTIDMIDQAMNEWVDYHQKMLDFLSSNDEKCILIEGKSALSNISKYKDEVKKIIDSLELKSGWQVASYEESLVAGLGGNTNIINELATNEILSKFPKLIDVFNSLLSKASLKTSENIFKTKRLDLDSLVSAVNYFNESEQRKNYELEKINTKLSKAYSEIASLKKSIDIHVGNTRILEEKLNQENKKLIESIKDYNSLSKDSKKIIDDLKKQAEDIKSQSIESIENENTQLINQIHVLQENLEKYLKNEDKQVVADVKQSKPIPIYYGAADRMKEDLPYRVGSAIINHSKSPSSIARLPSAVIKEYRDFDRNMKKNENLPAIEEYEDADDAMKVKSHLSYIIGLTITDALKSPSSIPKLPFKLSRDVLSFKLDKRKK
ncbi:hypothetical protein ACTXMD_01545 [Psychrobacter celer]|uniref:hypothetical protein n=1 Tax=Psychrobacter celer TaxID=306572 RepID=UPI003FD26436